LVASGTHPDEAEDLVATVDGERIAFIKHYFNADWPTRCLYHMMINTSVGDEKVVAMVLDTIQLLGGVDAPAGAGLRGVALK
jgi:hypothetical protein